MSLNMIKRLLIKDQRGMSLLTVLIFVFVLVTIGISLLAMSSNDIKLSSLHEDSTKAFYIAEAGLADALQRINQDWDNYHNWEDSPLTENYGEGSYSVSAEKKTIEGEEGETKDGIKLTSTGKVTQNGKTRGKRTVQLTVGQLAGESYSLFDYALAGKYEIKLEDVSTNISGDVYCDGNISNEGANLDGSAYATQSFYGDPDLISGSIYQGSAGDPVDVLEFPDPDVLKDYYSTTGTLEEKGGAGMETVIEEEEIYLNGDIYYYEGDLTISESTIHGPGVIMADGKIKFESNSVLGDGPDPLAPVGLFSFDNSPFSEEYPAIKFETESDAYGILYAPTGYVKIETDSAIYGSVIGAMVENISIKVETASEIIHEDYSGTGIVPIGEYVPAVVAWQEVN